jgi:hypothetical protein
MRPGVTSSPTACGLPRCPLCPLCCLVLSVSVSAGPSEGRAEPWGAGCSSSPLGPFGCPLSVELGPWTQPSAT